MTTSNGNDVIRYANIMLELLVSRSNSDWESVMKSTLNETELKLNMNTLESKLISNSLRAPVGAVEGGTGILSDVEGIPKSDRQAAIRLLKQQDRIQQCGRGRGKCLIVLYTNPIPVELESKEEVSVDESTSNDLDDVFSTSELTRMINDRFRDLERKADEAMRAKNQLEQHLIEKNEEIDRLNNQISHHAISTWQ